MSSFLRIVGATAFVALAQGIAAAETVRGVVTEVDTGEAVVGAIVAAGERATITDERGEFSIDGIVPGTVTLVITAGGYVTQEVALGSEQLGAELGIVLAYDLEGGEMIELSVAAPDNAQTPSYELSPEELRTVPGAGTDVLKSLQSLPGVSRIPFGAGGLVLRGASPRDTNVYLDGIEVPILYHFGGLASFYPSAMLEQIELAPGGFAAEFGRAQGGLVELTSRPGRDDRWRVAGEMSLIDASARADGPAAGGTWSFGVRRSYVDAILQLALPSDSSIRLTLAPRYYDTQVRYDAAVGQNDTVTVLAFASDDRLELAVDDADPDDPDGFRFESSFARLGVRWQRRDGDVVLNVLPWLGVEQTKIRVGDQGQTRTTYPVGLRADATRVFESGYLAGGVDVQGGRYDSFLKNEPPPMPGVEEMEVTIDTSRYTADTALWTEGLYRIEDGRLSLRPGLRVERYALSDEWVVDPRLTVSHELPFGITLKESLGLYHQPAIAADADWGDPQLQSSYAVQGSVGVSAAPRDDTEVSVTAFSQDSERLSVDVVSSASPVSAGGAAGGAGAASGELLYEQFGSWSYREPVGSGRAYGVELLAKHTGTRLYGWLSYTWSRSLRRDDPTRYTSYHPYVLDQPHVLTALGSYSLGADWRIGARVRYASGNPYTPVDGVYFDAGTQEYRPVDGALFSDRMPAFFQLDLRVDRQWRRSWGTLALFLDVQNATNRVNAEGVTYNYDYTELEYTRGLPVFPSIGLEYKP